MLGKKRQSERQHGRASSADRSGKNSEDKDPSAKQPIEMNSMCAASDASVSEDHCCETTIMLSSNENQLQKNDASVAAAKTQQYSPSYTFLGFWKWSGRSSGGTQMPDNKTNVGPPAVAQEVPSMHGTSRYSAAESAALKLLICLLLTLFTVSTMAFVIAASIYGLDASEAEVSENLDEDLSSIMATLYPLGSAPRHPNHHHLVLANSSSGSAEFTQSGEGIYGNATATVIHNESDRINVTRF